MFTNAPPAQVPATSVKPPSPTRVWSPRRHRRPHGLAERRGLAARICSCACSPHAAASSFAELGLRATVSGADALARLRPASPTRAPHGADLDLRDRSEPASASSNGRLLPAPPAASKPNARSVQTGAP
jgi:hypothetical protein